MKKKLLSALVQLLGISLGLVLAFPIIYALLGAFKTGAEFAAYPPRLLPLSFGNLENFKYVFTRVPMPRYMLNSLITSLLTASVKLILACLAAYAFSFYEFKGKRALFFIILASMMLPPDTLTITNYRTVSRMGLTNTYLGICVVGFVGASQMLMLIGRFKALPVEISDAAKLDGCGDLKFLLKIAAPMCKGILFTLFLQAFINQWNSYLWPLLVTDRDEMRTVQVGISMLTNPEATNYETVLAGAVTALVPSLILFFVSRRLITGTVTAGAVNE